jgi:hypothetical protein
MVHRTGQTPGRQLTIDQIGAVGEGLEHQWHIRLIRQLQFTLVVGQRQHHQRQALAVSRAGLQHGGEQGIVAHQVVVQRAMRFDVGQLGAGGAAEGLQRAELIQHQRGDLFGRAAQVPPAETNQVRIGRMGADTHIMAHRQGHAALHGQGVGGVEATGQVGLVDQRHGERIVAHLPGTEALTHVAVQEDSSVHAPSLERRQERHQWPDAIRAQAL